MSEVDMISARTSLAASSRWATSIDAVVQHRQEFGATARRFLTKCHWRW